MYQYVAIAIFILAPQIALGQLQPQVGKQPGSSQITCPTISCHLHKFPAEHCKVQTFFVYHGIECKGCVEDICYGSQTVADSLIGKELIVESIHQDPTHPHSQNEQSTNNIPGEWRRFNVIRPRENTNLPDPAVHSSLSVNGQSETIGQHGSMTMKGAKTSSKEIVPCPKIECELHHKPEEHCIVETYFLYHGTRCPGCIEDICLGAHSVPDTLIGKNDTTNLNANAETHKHGSIHQEHIDIERRNMGGLDSHTEMHNDGNQYKEQIGAFGGNRDGNNFDSNTQTLFQQRFNNNNRNNFRNPFFRGRNFNPMARNPQWNSQRISPDNFRLNNQRDNLNSRTNNRDTLSTSANERTSTFSQTRSGGSNNRNTQNVVVINQEPTNPALNSNGRGIRRFSGSARSYLQSLFHPTFSR